MDSILMLITLLAFVAFGLALSSIIWYAVDRSQAEVKTPDTPVVPIIVLPIVDPVIYVAPDGGSGDDANDGLSAGSAVVTVERALEILSATGFEGVGTVLFMRGTHSIVGDQTWSIGSESSKLTEIVFKGEWDASDTLLSGTVDSFLTVRSRPDLFPTITPTGAPVIPVGSLTNSVVRFPERKASGWCMGNDAATFEVVGAAIGLTAGDTFEVTPIMANVSGDNSTIYLVRSGPVMKVTFREFNLINTSVTSELVIPSFEFVFTVTTAEKWDTGDRTLSGDELIAGVWTSSNDANAQPFTTSIDATSKLLSEFQRCVFDQGVYGDGALSNRFEACHFASGARVDHSRTSSTLLLNVCLLDGVNSFAVSGNEGNINIFNCTIIDRARPFFFQVNISVTLSGFACDNSTLVMSIYGNSRIAMILPSVALTSPASSNVDGILLKTGSQIDNVDRILTGTNNSGFEIEMGALGQITIAAAQTAHNDFTDVASENVSVT